MGLNIEEYDYFKEEKKEEIEKLEEEPKKEILEKKQKNIKNLEKEENLESKIFVVKVGINKETKAFELISNRISSKKLEVYSLIRSHGLRGYLFIETKDKANAEEACFNLPYVKGILPKEVTYEEIKQMVEPITTEINIEKNDIVEIISEPFKKEQAKVIRVDKIKGEVVVSLLNAVIPLHVTVKIDNVRVIRREVENNQ
ncbi:MAG: transcription elongation factor Spt5 [Candidatus Pacearchaeota archaeon]